MEERLVTLALGKRLEKSLHMDVMELATVLKDTTYLYSLVIPALKRSSWKKLILTDNQLGDVGTTALAQALAAIGEGAYLRVLWLDRNSISSRGVVQLCGRGRSLDGLVELWLDENQITDEGAFAIAECFKQSRALLKLGLRKNELTDVGVSHLALNLFMDRKSNSRLQVLKLGNNKRVTDVGADILIRAAKYSFLSQLELEPNAVSVSKREEVKKIIRRINSRQFRLSVALCSARLLPRIGHRSPFRLLPSELVGKLMTFLMWPVKRHNEKPESA